MERFLDAIHEVGKEIERSRNNAGIKLVDGSEIDADCLDYFSDNKRDTESEFLAELQIKIGQCKAELFCDVIAKDWYDGSGLRSGPRVLGLKLSVRSRRPGSERISSDDIFLRRGLSLAAPLDEKIPYREWDYINSYSIAFSAPEKFAQMQTSRIAAMVNGDLGLFQGRILFFSPFIPKMAVGQLEAGVIPGERPEQIKAQGAHGGILEYILGERPEDFEVEASATRGIL
jgi:hypothetical protein